MFNNEQSHESSLHHLKPPDELRHDPGEITLPPYHPDTPEIRRDWAQYYDSIEDMDAWVGRMLDELEAAGEADNTIVFYYSDHGGALPRSKRFVYETGTRIPFVVRIPERFSHFRPGDRPGGTIDRLIGLVDLAPTMLSIAGILIPDFMQGNAFRGRRRAGAERATPSNPPTGRPNPPRSSTIVRPIPGTSIIWPTIPPTQAY